MVLLAARAGLVSDAERRAAALIEEIGFHPLLGPLPETRWLTGVPVAGPVEAPAEW